ncbi:MAG: GyrI-like domain-containing protein [Erysipelotrichaceae bacterium]|nr:GyrI-like domain-containing protein [Erysipelotrichaceae bacterium]
MVIERIIKESFAVVGKEGSTSDGEGFIQKLWKDANSNFKEIVQLAKKDQNGKLAGIWGAMSDFSRSFKPWDDFNKGLYLAGVECNKDVQAPEGWTKWIIPGYEYLRVQCEDNNTFRDMLKYMKENNIELTGAVHDFTDPETGNNYMCFPIRKL